MAAAGGRRMVQKESQAALEERESELNSNPAASAGASLEPQATMLRDRARAMAAARIFFILKSPFPCAGLGISLLTKLHLRV